MTVALLLMALLGGGPSGGGIAVFEQMRASQSAIQTLVCEFSAVDESSAKVSGTGKPTDVRVTGRLWFQEPNRLRIECSENGRSLTSTSDHLALRRLTIDSVTGAMSGHIANSERGAAAYSVVTGLGFLVPRAADDYLKNTDAFQSLSAQNNGSLIQLVGHRNNVQIEWDVDPEKGFSLVRQNDVTKISTGTLVTKTSFQLHEPLQGVWMMSHFRCEQRMNDELDHRITIEVVPGSCKVNVPLAKELFELEFPSGTEVTDMNQRKTYVAGGGSSQGRRKVAQLAAEARQLKIVAPTPPGDIVPQPGALSSVRPRSSGLFWIVGGAILMVGTSGFFMIRRRRQMQ